MKYIKLFESFCSNRHQDKLDDMSIKKLFGVSKEDIEHILSDINDEIDGVNISINFRVNGAYIDSNHVGVEDSEKGHSLKYDYEDCQNTSPITDLACEIKVFPTSGLLNRYNTNGNTSQRAYINVIPLVEKIVSIVRNNEIIEYFESIGFETEVYTKEMVENRIERHPGGFEHASSIFSLFMYPKDLYKMSYNIPVSESNEDGKIIPNKLEEEKYLEDIFLELQDIGLSTDVTQPNIESKTSVIRYTIAKYTLSYPDVDDEDYEETISHPFNGRIIIDAIETSHSYLISKGYSPSMMRILPSVGKRQRFGKWIDIDDYNRLLLILNTGDEIEEVIVHYTKVVL